MDGGRIACEVRGTGPNHVLLRPLGGSMLSWGRFAYELAERTRVIQFDARGTGLSSPTPWGTTTRIIDSPARVGRIVLASTLPRGSMVRTAMWRRGLALARCLAQPPPAAEASLAERILSSQFRAAHPDEARRIRDAARARPASHRALLTLLLAAARHDVRERLHEIEARVLVLIGEYDPLLTIDSQRLLLQRLRHASYEVIRGAGHDLSAEAPGTTAERVIASL
jgi:pimeloyl-ACP methyl ester carboxylesterase